MLYIQMEIDILVYFYFYDLMITKFIQNFFSRFYLIHYIHYNLYFKFHHLFIRKSRNKEAFEYLRITLFHHHLI